MNFAQHNGVNPLDPLGPIVGSLGQPSLDPNSYLPFEGEVIKPHVINFPDPGGDRRNTIGTPGIESRSKPKLTREDVRALNNSIIKNLSYKIASGRTKDEFATYQTYDAGQTSNPTTLGTFSKSKSQSTDAETAAINEYLDAMVDSAEDKNEWAKVYSYNPVLNDRYKNSPCFDEIGFNPSWDQKDLEKRYLECENKNKGKQRDNEILNISLIIAALGIVIYVIYDIYKITKK